ncbi:nose resistant to fluoxetine protein 6-like [Helicoverpa zea]|uniref:nose resistant to fluoxetine protein 6-like n=1 Tax=Helicoverpa zea TaxID=7113 RepID=UPI001F5782BD|nr:nose resistant to fluoxetine protein 6-like [Helicoverpa zea]
MKLWWCLLLLAAQAQARDVTDEEYAQFPRLFHLDEWESCLARPGGMYCLGTFSVEPLRHPSPLYNMLQEYSLDPHHFNRTELHRGYCVSSRCPALAGERNASLRFEQCAAQWARRVSLRTRLARLRYCRSHAQHVARAHSHEPPQRAQRMFLLAVTAILVCNVLGTAYDVFTGDNVKKNPLLASWSIRSNWRRLTASYEDGDPRLAALSPVQGVRVFLMLLIMATHSGCIHDMLYLYNPRWIEQISRHPVLMIFLNGTSVVQVFVLLSNFLLAYNLLLHSKEHSVSFKLLPYITVKRIARISPVYLLVVGFAATWWPSLGSGPQWTAAVAAESDACKRKFWTHAVYLNNLIDPEDLCLVQTWFLAVDMQLYVLASVLTVLLVRQRARALHVLGALACLSCALNGVLAYVFNWKSIVYFAYPSNLRTMYAGISSFSWLYQAPWGSLPACLVGLFLAFLHFELQEAGVKLSDYKWVRLPYHMSPALIMWWVLSGDTVRTHSAPWFTATYTALERPVLSLLAGGIVFGMVNGLEGWLKQVFSWRGWSALGRLSLSVLLLHWCINLSIAASRPQPVYSSLLSVVVDWLATSCLSYAAAVPLTLLLEMPALRTLNSLLLLKYKQA